jgi:SpoVK/Ycf46/Vps4 family AAA+-type ATPase
MQPHCVVQVDPSVTFDQVGGLDGYIDKLKEMIFLPLVYPELFERFNVAPPRGVLLYGPPGGSVTHDFSGSYRYSRLQVLSHVSCAGACA